MPAGDESVWIGLLSGGERKAYDVLLIGADGSGKVFTRYPAP